MRSYDYGANAPLASPRNHNFDVIGPYPNTSALVGRAKQCNDQDVDDCFCAHPLSKNTYSWRDILLRTMCTQEDELCIATYLVDAVILGRYHRN